MKNLSLMLLVLSSIILTLQSCNWQDGIIIPHVSEEVHFISGSFDVHGELITPEGDGPFPLVIMVHGDGPAYMGYCSKIKESILRAGFATLMWDKPGFGNSTENFLLQQIRTITLKHFNNFIKEMKCCIPLHWLLKGGTG